MTSPKLQWPPTTLTPRILPRPDLTIVTACDANYFWGALLLIGSLRSNGVNAPVHVLAKGFSDQQSESLEQIPGVKLIALAKDDPRGMVTCKPQALLSATSEWVAWVDADCLSVGNISELFIPENGSFQIRMRGEAENAEIYADKYGAGDRWGGLPGQIVEQWKSDVGEFRSPRYQTTAVANVMVFHRKHRDFIKRWDQQMEKVIPSGAAPVIEGLRAYHMTDESVLNSLLAFSFLAPPVSPFTLNRLPDRHMAHFGGKVKPWMRWTEQGWPYYESVRKVMNWVRENNYRIPSPPSSLRPGRKQLARGRLVASSMMGRLRRLARDVAQS